jgi:hypothetical protein
MEKLNFIVIFFYLFGFNAYAETVKYEWDVPEFKQKQDVGPSNSLEDKTRHVNLVCQVYKQFTLFITADPGLKGASYKVRDRQKTVTTKQECVLMPNEKLADFFGGALQGVIGANLILLDDGMLGDESTLVIIDALSGRTLMRALYDDSSPIKVTKENTHVQMTYFAFLNEPKHACDLKSDKTGSCFRETLEFNHVPDASKIKKPNCPVDIETPALFLQARVTDIQKPTPDFIGKALRCAGRQ